MGGVISRFRIEQLFRPSTPKHSMRKHSFHKLHSFLNLEWLKRWWWQKLRESAVDLLIAQALFSLKFLPNLLIVVMNKITHCSNVFL
jgi:hypothetical protein